MKLIKILKNIASGLLCVGFLAGCGGDDNSSTPSNPNPNPPPISTPKISLQFNANISDIAGASIDNATINISQNGAILKTLTTDSSGKINNEKIEVEQNINIIADIIKNSYTKQVQNLGKFNQNSSINLQASLLKPTMNTSVALTGSGLVSINNSGAKVEFNKDAFIDSNGNVATGNIDVSLTIFNPHLSPNAFPGNPNVTNANQEPALLASLGMVDFSFSKDNKKLNLATGKEATITIPLFSIYDDNGKELNIGDSVPFWTMNSQTGTWTQEGSGIIIADSSSQSGLAVTGKVKHFSWWNLDYPIKLVNKTIEIYEENCTTKFVGTTGIEAYFTQAVPDSLIFGSTSRLGYTTIQNGSATLGFPIGFNAQINGGYTSDNLYELTPKTFTWNEINSSNILKLCLQKVQPRIVIYPNSDVNVPLGNKYYFAYQMFGLPSSEGTWSVDDIVGGNSSIGTINAGVYDTKDVAITGMHTIKVTSVSNPNISKSVNINILDNLTLKNQVLVNDIDVFDGLNTDNQTPNQYRGSTLIKGYTNILIPYLNGVKIPASLVKLECSHYTNNEQMVVGCSDIGVNIVNNQITTNTNYPNNASGFTIDELRSNTAWNTSSITIKASLITNESINTTQYFNIRDLYSLQLNGSYPYTTYQYNLSTIDTKDISSKLNNNIDWKVYCVKDDAPCLPVAENKRPRITVRKDDKAIDILNPDTDFDSSEEYYLAGVFKDDIQNIHSLLVSKLYCSVTSSASSLDNSGLGVVCSASGSNYLSLNELQFPISTLNTSKLS